MPDTEPDLNAESRHIWNRNADYWDRKMGDGNDWHNILVAPETDRLLDLKPDERVIDIACGNGLYARKLARRGARVLAFDFSDQLIQHARARSADPADRIDYRVLDATDTAGLLALGERAFDAAVSNMALFDMADIEPLFSALSRLLKPGGRFVFSVIHPCFNSGDYKRCMAQVERDGDIVNEYYVQVHAYIHPLTCKGLAIRGQPVAQYYFHRPISQIFNIGFKAGFVLDGIEEPVFGDRGNNSLCDQVYREISPVLIARMRLPE